MKHQINSVTQDLRWQRNTDYICSKARAKLWIIRRLIQFDLDTHTLFDVYCKEIRSIVEMAVPVWHSSLTKKQSMEIERIQKLAFRLILRNDYVNYQLACSTLSALTLAERRIQICRKFAFKNLKSQNPLFSPCEMNMKTRNKNKIVKEFRCNTNRYKNSSLPYLCTLINQ